MGRGIKGLIKDLLNQIINVLWYLMKYFIHMKHSTSFIINGHENKIKIYFGIKSAAIRQKSRTCISMNKKMYFCDICKKITKCK